jgi:hypothetical protein
MRQMCLADHQGRRASAGAELEEKKRLGERVARGYRLACQLWLTHDIELSQEAAPLADVVAPSNTAVAAAVKT